MITYDGLRVLKMAEDDLKQFLGLFWAVRASQPTNKSENKTPCVFFIVRLMVMLPDVEI